MPKQKLYHPSYPIFNTLKFDDTKLSPLERDQLKDFELDLNELKARYENVATRTKKRGSNPVPRCQFLRAYIHAIKKLSATLKSSKHDVLKFDIHSVNLHDYVEFQLLPKETHRELHKSSGLRTQFRCKYCGELQDSSEFVPDERVTRGFILTCRHCKSQLIKEYRALKRSV